MPASKHHLQADVSQGPPPAAPRARARLAGMLAALAAASMLAPAAALAADDGVWAPLGIRFWWVPSVTTLGAQTEAIYYLIMWVCVIMFLLVEVALVYAIFKFRKKPGEDRKPATWSHNTALETIWTAIPFALVIMIVYFSINTLRTVANEYKSADLTLEIVGHQFYWEYRYPDLGIQFNTTPRTGGGSGQEEMVVPVDRTIKCILTSADVIHSWWVPAFGWQQMCTPGRLSVIGLRLKPSAVNQTYNGACSFLCGTLHGAMNIKVHAVDKAGFDAWVAKAQAETKSRGVKLEPIEKVGKIVGVPGNGPQGPAGKQSETKSNDKGKAGELPSEPTKPSSAPMSEADTKALAEKGKATYGAKCASCHGAAGAGIPGVFPPLAGAEPVADDKVVGIVLNGLSGSVTVKGTTYNGAMPAWKGTLSDDEIAGVITYVRSSWGNKSPAVSPSMVKAAPH